MNIYLRFQSHWSTRAFSCSRQTALATKIFWSLTCSLILNSYFCFTTIHSYPSLSKQAKHCSSSIYILATPRFLQFCECVWRMEPHTWNANGQDFTCIAIIQFPIHLPYKQIQYLYAKVTTDYKKSPLCFNVTSPRMGSPARQGNGTLQRIPQGWYTEALPERSSAPFLVVWLSFLQKQKKRKKRKFSWGIHQTHTTGTFYPHKKAALSSVLLLRPLFWSPQFTQVQVPVLFWKHHLRSFFFIVVLCN